MKIAKFLPIIGIILFLYILLNLDLSRLLETLTNISLYPLIISIVLIIPPLLIKALKWNILIRSYNISYSFRRSVLAWLVGFSIGLITPGRLGDLSRAYYLKDKMTLGKSITTVVIDRIIDVLILFCWTVLGLLIFITIYAGQTTLFFYIFAVFLVFLILVYLFTKKGFVALVLKPLFRRFIPEKYKQKLSIIFNDFYTGLEIMKRRKLFLFSSIVLGVLAWFVSIFQYYFLALALNLQVSYYFLLMVIPVTILIDSLPVSFSGIGTREAALIFFLSFIGIQAEPAVSFSIIILLTGYLIMGFIGLLLWFRKPIKISI